MTARPTKWPNYHEGDFVLRNYVFRSGETLPELRLHYRTLGTPRRNATGKIINGVPLLKGNTGTGANWLRPSLAEELFGPGQPLDPPRPMASCMIRYDAAFHDIGSSHRCPRRAPPDSAARHVDARTRSARHRLRHRLFESRTRVWASSMNERVGIAGAPRYCEGSV
jgi:hypothetical protein